MSVTFLLVVPGAAIIGTLAVIFHVFLRRRRGPAATAAVIEKKRKIRTIAAALEREAMRNGDLPVGFKEFVRRVDVSVISTNGYLNLAHVWVAKNFRAAWRWYRATCPDSASVASRQAA